MDDVLHIAYCGDRDYVPILGVSMTSVIWHNTDQKIFFHLLVDDIAPEDAARLQQMYRLYRNIAGIAVHRMPAEHPSLQVFRSVHSAYAVAVNYRLLLPKVLPPDVKRVLYLDGDIICCSSLRPLYGLELGDNLAAGVPDPLENMHKKRTKLASYVNSGVLLMNLERWRQENILAAQLAFYEQHAALDFPDQDAINTLCHGRILRLPLCYNYPVSCNFTTRGRRNDIAPDACLCHFLGPITKPWYVTCLDPRAKLWELNRNRSVWYDLPLAGDADLYKEMQTITVLFADGKGEQAFRRYRKVIQARGCHFEPIVIRQKDWK